MGLGSTAKKVQQLADRAEQLYAQLKDIRKRVIALEQSVDDSTNRIATLESSLEKQLVLLEEIARDQGIDADQVLADAAIDEAESAGTADATGAGGDSTDAVTDDSDESAQSDPADEAAGS
jgi:chromosome segregation ATPase